MIPIYNSENELSHWVSIQRMLHEKKQEKEKEQLIRNQQNNKDSKRISYIIT
jgi:hypothetical protein